MTNSGHVFERLDTVRSPQHEHESMTRPAIHLVEPTGVQAEDAARVEDFELPTRYLAVKYASSRVVAALLLVAVAPILAVIAGLLRAKLGKGVIYRQSRVGRNGEDFEILKFRTMAADRRMRSHDVEQDRRQTHKCDNDPRHNSLGRLLRKTSLDELPQLWNVVRGDMTLVGPRPELSTVADQYGFRHHPRHVVVPGITGLWQVSEYRHELLHEHIEVDVEYVQQVSLGLDLRIIGRTLMAFVRPTGR